MPASSLKLLKAPIQYVHGKNRKHNIPQRFLRQLKVIHEPHEQQRQRSGAPQKHNRREQKSDSAADRERDRREQHVHVDLAVRQVPLKEKHKEVVEEAGNDPDHQIACQRRDYESREQAEEIAFDQIGDDGADDREGALQNDDRGPLPQR